MVAVLLAAVALRAAVAVAVLRVGLAMLRAVETPIREDVKERAGLVVAAEGSMAGRCRSAPRSCMT